MKRELENARNDLPASDSRGCAARFRGFAAKNLLRARQQDRPGREKTI